MNGATAVRHRDSRSASSPAARRVCSLLGHVSSSIACVGAARGGHTRADHDNHARHVDHHTREVTDHHCCRPRPPPRQPHRRPASNGSPVAATPAPPASSRPLLLTPNDGGTVTVVDRQRTYRGSIDVVPTDTGVRLVNQVDVEQYLRGMGEVRDPSWPAAALRTQAVAARTYALRAMAAAGELCDNTALPGVPRPTGRVRGDGQGGSRDRGPGARLPQGRWRRPCTRPTAAATRPAAKRVRYDRRRLPLPPRRAVRDEGPDAVDRGRRPGRPGRPRRRGADYRCACGRRRAVGPGPHRRTRGPGRRPHVSGRAFAAGLGLRSTMFTLRMGVAEVAPPPPTGGAVLQSLPDEVAIVEAPAAPRPR